MSTWVSTSKLSKITDAIQAAIKKKLTATGIKNDDQTTDSGYVADARIVKTHGDEIDALSLKVGDLYFDTDSNGKWGYKTKKNGAVTPFRNPTGNAAPGEVLSGKIFSSASQENAAGTMPNRGAWTGATTGDGNVAIPEGYHDGKGYVTGAGAYNKGVSDADARVNANSASYKSGYTNGNSAGYSSGKTDGYNSGYADGKSGATITSISDAGSANQTISTVPGGIYVCFGLGNNVNGPIVWSISGAVSLWGTGGSSGGQQAKVNVVRATGNSMTVSCGNHVASSVVRLNIG